MDQTRMGRCEAGVGRPRGRGLFIRRDSPGVINIPWPTFSLFSVDDFPVLRLDHPRADRLAFEGTRGLAPVARPKAFSRFGSTTETKVECGLTFSTCRSGDKTFGLTGMGCSAGGLFLAKDRLISATEERLVSGDKDTLVLRAWGYGDTLDCVRERMRRGRSSDGSGP